MKRSGEGWREAWLRWPRALEERWRGTTTAQERAAAAADLLAETVASAVTACLLDGAAGGAVAVHPATGSDAAAVRDGLFGWRPDGPPPELPAGLTAPFAAGAGGRGLLAVVPRRGLAAAERAALPALLGLAADALALRLELRAARAECAALAEPALLGEAAGALTHELNNHLNSMVLQAAIVQAKVDESLRDALTLIRQGGAKAAALLRPIAQARARRKEVRRPVDLNAVVRRVAEARGVPADLADGLPPLSANDADVRRLVELLAEVAAVGPDARLATGAEAGAVVLRAEGAAEEEALAPRLEGLALQSLVRLSGARLDVVRDGPAVFRVTWGPEARV